VQFGRRTEASASRAPPPTRRSPVFRKGHLSSVHQLRLHHGFHHLILSDQLVPVDGVRVNVQSGTDIGMPQHGLYRLDVSLIAEQLQPEIAQASMAIRTASKRPMKLAIRFSDREVIDACQPQTHQSLFVELPSLISIRAEPIP
jgi:hypothetical protein